MLLLLMKEEFNDRVNDDDSMTQWLNDKKWLEVLVVEKGLLIISIFIVAVCYFFFI